MGKAIRLSLGFILSAFHAPSAYAQKEKGTAASKQRQTRSLTHTAPAAEVPRTEYESGRSDGMKLTIFQLREGRLVAVDPGQPFKSGDRIRIKFESNFDGYVYVVNLTPGGQSRLIYPYPNRSNRVRAGQRYDLPRSGEFTFDREPGEEVLQVVMSRTLVGFLEAALDVALEKSSNVLDASAAKQLEYLTGKFKRRKQGGIFHYGDQASRARGAEKQPAQTRSLTLAPGKDDTVLILSGRKNTPSRLGPREVSVFEIRLQHR